MSKQRVNEECIGPYAVLVFDPTDPEAIGFLATITRILAEKKIPILAPIVVMIETTFLYLIVD